MECQSWSVGQAFNYHWDDQHGTSKMKACSCVIFTGMSKLSLDSRYIMWTAYCSLKINSTASHGKKSEIRGSPNSSQTGKIKWQIWLAIVSMQVLPVFYTQRWTVVTISLTLRLGPGLARASLYEPISYGSDL